MKYYDIKLNPSGELTVQERSVVSTPMPEPSRGAATGPLLAPRTGASSTLLVNVEPKGVVFDHESANDGLVFVLAGSGQLGLSGHASVSFVAGDALMVPAKVMHGWQAHDEGFVLGVVIMGKSEMRSLDTSTTVGIRT